MSDSKLHSDKILKDRIFTSLIYFLALAILIPLFIILVQIFMKGRHIFNLELFTSIPNPPDEEGGGILNAIIGSGLLVALATVMAVPLGIFIGVYLSEFKGKLTEFIGLAISVLQGLPSILIGILVYLWVVRPLGGFSVFSGGIALGLMMLPIVVKNTEETLKLIPYSMKEASYALGASYPQTILEIIIPAGFQGILTGVLIGISRIIGETAPLLFTAFGNPFISFNLGKPIDSLPLLIFNYSTSPYENWHKIAWGAAMVLVIIILILNFIIKFRGVKNKKIKWKRK